MHPPRQCSILIRPRGSKSALSLLLLPRDPRVSSTAQHSLEQFPVNLDSDRRNKSTKFTKMRRLNSRCYKSSNGGLKGAQTRYPPRLSVTALGTFEQISTLLNSSHCLPTDRVLPDDEHKARIRNSNKRVRIRACTYVRRSKMRSAHTATQRRKMRRTRVKRNGCIIGMRLRCNYLPITIFYNFSTIERVKFFPLLLQGMR